MRETPGTYALLARGGFHRLEMAFQGPMGGIQKGENGGAVLRERGYSSPAGNACPIRYPYTQDLLSYLLGTA